MTIINISSETESEVPSLINFDCRPIRILLVQRASVYFRVDNDQRTHLRLA